MIHRMIWGKSLGFFILISSFWFQAGGQSVLKGTITDKFTQESLPGVNIFLPDYERGTVSDENGQYRIENVRPGLLLVQFSFVGYRTVIRDIPVNQAETEINITMEPDVVEGEEIVVTGGFPSSQHNNVVKITTIRPDEIDQSGSPSIMKSVTEIPGVDLISKGPGVGTPVVRGLSLTNILVLNNGVPMENFQFSEEHPFLIDESGVERVEVIKGPASLLYGSGAVGGVINLIREAPAPAGKIQGDFQQKYFSNTNGYLSEAGIKGTHKSVTWGLRGMTNNHMDYTDGAGNRVPNTRFNRQSVKTTLGFLKSFGSFRFFYEGSKDKLGMAVEPALPLVQTNGRTNNVWYQDLTDHIFSSKNNIFIKRFKFNLDLAYQLNNRKLHGSDSTSVPVLVDMTLRTFNYKLLTTIPTEPNTKIMFGLQGMTQNNKNGIAPQHVVPDASMVNFSVFGLGQHYHWDKLMIQAGLRWDYRNINVPQYIASGHSHSGLPAEADTLPALNRNYQNFSGSLGAVLNLCDSIHFRLNVASAFRSPNLAELTQYGEHGTRFEQGNRDLKSQNNLETDLSFHYHSRHATIDIAGFYNNILNYIFLSPTRDTTDDGDKIYRYAQVHAFLYGGEVMLHIHPKSLEWLHLKTTWSLVRGVQAGNENLPFIPAQKVGAEVQLSAKKWKQFRNMYVTGRISRSFAQNSPAQFETPTPAYTLVYLGSGANLPIGSHKVTFGIFVNNLLNEIYYDHLSTLKDAGLNNMGRNITGMIRLQF